MDRSAINKRLKNLVLSVYPDAYDFNENESICPNAIICKIPYKMGTTPNAVYLTLGKEGNLYSGASRFGGGKSSDPIEAIKKANIPIYDNTECKLIIGNKTTKISQAQDFLNMFRQNQK